MENHVREYWVGVNHFLLDNEDIIHATTIGDMDDETAVKCAEAASKLQSLVLGRKNILVDLNKSGKQSHGARNVWRQLTENTPDSRIAMYGVHPVARVLASFFIGMLRNRSVRFFKNQEEALTWLKEK